MNDNYTIEVRFGGSELTPAKVRSSDIAKLITAVEQMLAAIVARDNPDLDIAEKQVTVGLAKVTQGSIGLQFESQYAPQVQRAYDTATSAIASEAFDDLPPRTVDALKSVIALNRAYASETVFGRHNGQFSPVAKLTTATEIKRSVHEISGETVLYGVLFGISGDNPPVAKLRLPDGEKFDCNVTEVDNLAVARALGKRLYTDVAVRGEARWDVRDMSMTFFRIDELLEYERVPASKALEDLYEAIGHHFEALDDIHEFLDDVRYADEGSA